MAKIKNFFKFIEDKILEGIAFMIIGILTLFALPVWVIKKGIEKLQEKIKRKKRKRR